MAAWTNPQQQTTGTLINETIWNEQVADNIDYLGAAVEPDMLANRSGGQVTAGAVVIVDAGNDSSFKVTTTADDPLAWGVVMETINNNAAGRVATTGVVTVNVQGNVTRGNFLSTSTTAGRARDAGTSKTNATFAIALTGYAGGAAGTVTALLLASLGAGVQSSRAINTTAPLAGGGDLSADRTLSIGAASEAASGVAELATQAETDAGTDDARIVTPLKLKSSPLDHLTVSKLWESDGGAAAWQTDAAGALIGQSAQPLKGKSSNFPNLGSTTLAEKIGNIYLGTAKDLFADDDDFALFNRLINYGYTPDEHWRGGAEVLTWLGWAAYTGFVTPSSLTISQSQYAVAHNAAAKAFRYRAAATGDYIALRIRGSIGRIAAVGVMVDDGVNNADGNGANNYYTAFLSQTAAFNPVQAVVQTRAGGAAPTTTTSTFELDWTLFHGCGFYTSGTRWTSWNAIPILFGEDGALKEFGGQITGQTWTPARVGIIFSNAGGGLAPLTRVGYFDWYDEATA